MPSLSFDSMRYSLPLANGSPVSVAADAVQTALMAGPEVSTGPVGWPVGEPPSGSIDTASVSAITGMVACCGPTRRPRRGSSRPTARGMPSRPIRQPSLYIWGAADGLCRMFHPQAPSVDDMRPAAPRLVDIIQLDGVGHWIQHEASDRLNQEILTFLQVIDAAAGTRN